MIKNMIYYTLFLFISETYVELFYTKNFSFFFFSSSSLVINFTLNFFFPIHLIRVKSLKENQQIASILFQRCFSSGLWIYRYITWCQKYICINIYSWFRLNFPINKITNMQSQIITMFKLPLKLASVIIQSLNRVK